MEDSLRGLSLRLGRFRIDQIAGTDHNHVDYLASTYRRVIPGKARLQWEHEIKWVEDDIPNHTFQYLLDEEEVDVEGGYKSVFVIDGLEMRNSTVNRGYVGTHWSPLRGLNLVNNIRYELNSKQQAQFADGTSQEAEELNTWAMVNKADYTGVWWRFRLQPMFKHILLKQDLQGGAGPGGIDGGGTSPKSYPSSWAVTSSPTAPRWNSASKVCPFSRSALSTGKMKRWTSRRRPI